MGENDRIIFTRAPLCVHVVFEPACDESPVLARLLYRWLRVRELDDDGGSAGLPVGYRASPAALEQLIAELRATRTGSDKAPPQPPQNDVLVVLCDDHMLLDARWRKQLEALEALVDTPLSIPADLLIYPVMLSPGMTKLPSFGRRFNPLRLWKEDGDRPPLAPERDHWYARRFGRLRRAFADQVVRDLQPPAMEAWDKNEWQPLPAPEEGRLQTFISHAKQDGEEIAQHLRDHLARYSRLSSWFDQNDLQAGRVADKPMARAARTTSGGFIAVSTPAYATRPWCWREAQEARRPRLLRLQRGAHWLLLTQPGVVVQHPTRQWGRTAPPLARLPYIAWHGSPDEDCTPALIDRLYLELLLQRVFCLQVKELTPGDAARPDQVFIGFIPDNWSIPLIVQEVRRALPEPRPMELIYPGHGLRPDERRDLKETLDALTGPSCWTLRTMEELLRGQSDQDLLPPEAPWIALSGGGDTRELYKDGVSAEHLEDFMLRLTRALVAHGFCVAYGGTLTPPDGQKQDNFVETLLQVARGWRDDQQSPPSTLEEGRNVRNYVSFGLHDKLTPAFRAEHLDTCEFILVDAPRTAMTQEDPTLAWSHRLGAQRDTAARLRRTADALTHMRKVSTLQTSARVLFGGKIYGWAGWLPGIAEELLQNLKAQRPFLLLGGLGGISKVIADFLTAPAAAWPRELTFAEHDRRRGKVDAWGEAEREDQRAKFGELERELVRWKKQLHSPNQHHISCFPKSDWLDLAKEDRQLLLLRNVTALLTKHLPSPPPVSPPWRAAEVLRDHPEDG